ncbi:hypothetical protein LPW26_20450 [Rhodopseudomonas sp. HC1]|uniref:hypothetical protein n=1 Tax=Rhodopseudomonas infernalis TaxID=2897386 RepID=UPI001EE9A35A|nr:hypothetical protein [Rhodopseudomonas infernalis]MCG6207022.1 hypothetical protein [Rhodopseudomonas infernalis]
MRLLSTTTLIVALLSVSAARAQAPMPGSGVAVDPMTGAQSPGSAGISSAPGGSSTSATGTGLTGTTTGSNLNSPGINQPGVPNTSSPGTIGSGASPSGLPGDSPTSPGFPSPVGR